MNCSVFWLYIVCVFLWCMGNIYPILLNLYLEYQNMSQNHKNGQTTQTSNVKTARLLWVKLSYTNKSQTENIISSTLTLAHLNNTNLRQITSYISSYLIIQFIIKRLLGMTSIYVFNYVMKYSICIPQIMILFFQNF